MSELYLAISEFNLTASRRYSGTASKTCRGLRCARRIGRTYRRGETQEEEKERTFRWWRRRRALREEGQKEKEAEVDRGGRWKCLVACCPFSLSLSYI